MGVKSYLLLQYDTDTPNVPVLVNPTLEGSAKFPMSGLSDNAKTKLDQIPLVGSAAYQQASAFDPAGTAETLISGLTDGSPAELNTFIEAYNRFLSGESAASANVAAIAAEATARASAITSEANARTSGDAANANAVTSEASARASAIIAITPHRETATLDFGYADGNGEGDLARTTISAPYVSATSRIVCLPSPADSADHSTDETLLEDIRFSAVNIVPSTSFDIVAVAPCGTWGRHDCVALVQ